MSEHFMRQYLSWKATYATSASLSYRPWVEKFISFTKKDVDTAEVGDIINFRKLLDNHYQPKTIELAMIIIKNYFKFWKLAGLNCLSPELIKVPRTVANSHQAISLKEYCSVLSQIHVTDFWELQKLIIIRLLYETGVRVSELCDLNISNIDPERMSTTIRTKKTAKYRTIFWGEDTHQVLKEFLTQRIVLNSTPALFVAKFTDGTPTKRMSTRTVERMVKELCRKAGISKKIVVHSFRHAKAHSILSGNNGTTARGTVKDVQAILGHLDPRSSFTYLQWNDKEFEERAKMFLPC